MALAVEAQGPVAWAKNAWTYPCYDVTDKKLKSKISQYFLIETTYNTFRIFRGCEQPSSSICWRVMMAHVCAKKLHTSVQKNGTRLCKKVAHAGI